MNIWTIKEGEPLPIEGSSGRIMRCGIVSAMLAGRGHTVTWWSSTYFHQLKKCLRDEDTVVKIEDNYSIRLLHSWITYRQNVSLSRFIYSKTLGHLFAREARKSKKPDAIFCAYPLIDLAYEAVKYGVENNVPVIVDIRDFWPDIFMQPFPKVLHPIVKLATTSSRKRAEYCIQHATICTGVVPYCLEWSKAKGRQPNERDMTVYLGYRKINYSSEEIANATKFWINLGIHKEDIIACYFGNITDRSVNFKSIVCAASALRNIKFVVCGEGAYLDTLKEVTGGLSNFICPGYIDQVKIQVLMGIADFGLLPYYNTEDFLNAMPNKVIEYFSGGLVVVSSLQGFLKVLLDDSNAGFSYESDEDLISQLNSLSNNEKQLSTMKNNAEQLYVDEFNADKVYGALCDQIERSAGKNDKNMPCNKCAQQR